MSNENVKGELARIDKAVDAMLATEVADLIRKETLGALAFDAWAPQFEAMKDLALILKDYDFTRLPDPTIKGLSNCVAEGETIFQDIRNFDPRSGNPTQWQAQFYQRLQQAHQQMLSAIVPLVPLKSFLPGLSQLGDRLQTLNMEAEKNKHELDSILAGARESSVAIGVQGEGKHFNAEARQHARRAAVWLVATLLLTAALLGVVARTYFYPMPTPTGDQLIVIQRLGSKLIFISVLSGLLVFCARNYSTSRHNFVVNRHRAVALQTFRQFVGGTADTKTKDAVLLQAARSVFTAQTSGYLRKDGGEQQSAGPVLEIVRTITGRG